MDREVEDEKKLKQGRLIILKVGWCGVIKMNRIMQKQSMGLKITHTLEELLR